MRRSVGTIRSPNLYNQNRRSGEGIKVRCRGLTIILTWNVERSTYKTRAWQGPWQEKRSPFQLTIPYPKHLPPVRSQYMSWNVKL